MSQLPIGLQWLQAIMQILLIPAVAWFGAWIAHQQIHLAAVKIRLDLYQRRFAAFEKIRQFFQSVFKDAKVSNEALALYLEGVSEVDFLFNGKIVSFLNIVWNDAVLLQQKTRELRDPDTDSASKGQLAKEEAILLGKIFEHSKELNGIFKPLLCVDPNDRLDLSRSTIWQDWVQGTKPNDQNAKNLK